MFHENMMGKGLGQGLAYLSLVTIGLLEYRQSLGAANRVQGAIYCCW